MSVGSGLVAAGGQWEPACPGTPPPSCVTGPSVDIPAPSRFPLLGRAQTTPPKSLGSGHQTKLWQGQFRAAPCSSGGSARARAPSRRLLRFCQHWGRKRFCGTVGPGIKLKQAQAGTEPTAISTPGTLVMAARPVWLRNPSPCGVQSWTQATHLTALLSRKGGQPPKAAGAERPVPPQPPSPDRKSLLVPLPLN